MPHNAARQKVRLVELNGFSVARTVCSDCMHYLPERLSQNGESRVGREEKKKKRPQGLAAMRASVKELSSSFRGRLLVISIALIGAWNVPLRGKTDRRQRIRSLGATTVSHGPWQSFRQ